MDSQKAAKMSPPAQGSASTQPTSSNASPAARGLARFSWRPTRQEAATSAAQSQALDHTTPERNNAEADAWATQINEAPKSPFDSLEASSVLPGGERSRPTATFSWRPTLDERGSGASRGSYSAACNLRSGGQGRPAPTFSWRPQPNELNLGSSDSLDELLEQQSAQRHTSPSTSMASHPGPSSPLSSVQQKDHPGSPKEESTGVSSPSWAHAATTEVNEFCHGRQGGIDVEEQVKQEEPTRGIGRAIGKRE